MERLYCRNLAEWRQWLLENHQSKASVWLVFWKNKSKAQQLDYHGALDEALCFGWIDSVIKRIDDERYQRRFSRRRPKSNWSEKNKAKIQLLIEQNRLRAAGYEAVNAAKADGSWDKAARQEIRDEVPETLQKALDENNEARAFFEKLPPSERKRYIWWIATAKKKETIAKRVKESIDLLKNRERLGLK